MARIIRKNRRSSGFTLVEVLLVVFMLALTALMFAATFPTSQISRIKATHMSYALSLAQQKVEEIKSAGYGNIQITPTPVTSSLADIPSGTQTVTVTQYEANIKKISVSIVWSGYRQVGGTVDLVTLISDHG
ncbi:MAG TPA: type II secretion system protein [Armatimonadota bacterium]|nr:type II secretion system protein [Armatimonadota bacterium]